MPRTSARLQKVRECRIREMTRLANDGNTINLAQGFPDFDPPKELVEAAQSALVRGFHQYAPTWGSQSLREAIATKQSRFMGIDVNANRNVTVTCGATEAMMAAILAACDHGDKVALFSPFYENYAAAAALAGVDPIFIDLYPPDFRFDPHEVRSAFQSGVKALILCNPSNPCGRVFTITELSAIANMALEYDAFVITDEVYEHIFYEPNQHIYFASLPGMYDRTISCGSLSKTYSITGWRLGYVIASESVTAEIRKAHDFLTVGAPSPLQEAAICAVGFPESYYKRLQTEYTERRDIFLASLRAVKLPHVVPEGTYFVLVDIAGLGFRDDFKFCKWLIQEIGIAAVPGSVFFQNAQTRYVRFHFSKKLETLYAAADRLEGLYARL